MGEINTEGKAIWREVVETPSADNGEQFFSIICDEDFSRAYYPEIPQCTRKTAEILGPANVGGARPDVAWCIQAEPGTQFRVEFYCTDTFKSVTWFRMKEASLLDGQDISS